MDSKLFSYLQRSCKLIRPEQCLALPAQGDYEIYDSRRGDHLTLMLQLINLYTRKMHTFIPALECVWCDGDNFCLQTSDIKNMRTLSAVLPTLGNDTLFMLLAEFCTALVFMHQQGVHYGLMHETMLFMSKDMKRIYAKGIGYIDNDEPLPNFVARRAADHRSLFGMVSRISLERKTADFGRVLQLLAVSDIGEATNELRALAWHEAVHDRTIISSWQKTIMASVLTTHEIRYVPVPLDTLFTSCLREFVTLNTTTPVLPIFIEQGCTERGISATVPILNALFDFFVLNNILTLHEGSDGLLPAVIHPGQLDLEPIKYAYILLGYLVAYVFVLNIPLRCQLSRLLVMFVMHDKLDARLTPADRQVLGQVRQQFCFMRTGALKLRELSFFNSIPTARLFDYFYNCANNVTVPELGVENFNFTDLTTQERTVIMRWLRGLQPEPATKLTRLLTNSTAVSRHTCTITFKKNPSQLFMGTCDCIIDLPGAWLSDADTLGQNMGVQINDLSFNGL